MDVYSTYFIVAKIVMVLSPQPYTTTLLDKKYYIKYAEIYASKLVIQQ